jgi:hypothetical protein
MPAVRTAGIFVFGMASALSWVATFFPLFHLLIATQCGRTEISSGDTPAAYDVRRSQHSASRGADQGSIRASANPQHRVGSALPGI